MRIKGNHPLAEIIAKKLSGIGSIPPEEARRMISRCANSAVEYHEDALERLETLKKSVEELVREWNDGAEAETMAECVIELEEILDDFPMDSEENEVFEKI